MDRNPERWLLDTPVLPSSIKCTLGGEWKDKSSFSKSQLQRFQRTLRAKRGTASNSGISCTTHAPGTAAEMQCEGPCNKYHPLDFFSKRARKQGNRAWCKACMEWSESLEPGCIPWAPPTGIRSPDEHLDALRARISAGVRPSIDTLVAGVNAPAANEAGALSDGSSIGSTVHEARQAQHAAPVFNQALAINEVPVVNQAPIVNQVPVVNQDWSTNKATASNLSTASNQRRVFDPRAYGANDLFVNPIPQLHSSGPAGRASVAATTMAPSIHSDGLEPPSPRAQIAAYRRAERSVSMGSEHMGSEYGAVADEAPTVGTGPVTVLKNGWIKKSQRKTGPALPAYLMDPDLQPTLEDETPRVPQYHSDDGDSVDGDW